MAHFTKEWVLQGIASAVRTRRNKIKAATDPQIRLFGFKPPKFIVLRSGERIEFDQATLRRLRQHRAVLWNDGRHRKSRRIARLDHIIDVMSKYAAKSRGIKVCAVLALTFGEGEACSAVWNAVP